MILKKQEKENKIKAIYSSSNICASTYDKDNQTLSIIFNNGGQYLYENVSSTDYTRFELADSQGAIFNSHIKKYSFKKLDKVDPTEILNEVNNYKESEDKIVLNHATKTMIESMRAIITYYDTTNNVDSGQFSTVKEKIEAYDALTTKKDGVKG